MVKIGLIGFGNVGKAFVKLITERYPQWKFVFILKSDGGIIQKEGIVLENDVLPFENDLSKSPQFQKNLNWRETLKERPDYLVELSPTNLKDAEPAYTYISSALSLGISVVTGNKGPVVRYYKALKKLADDHEATLHIGCTVGAALPSAILGQYGLAGAKIVSVQGVLTGTTNYILNEMRQGKDFETVLQEAQKAGIAETNPSMDIDGFDTAIKMCILVNCLMGTSLQLSDVEIRGIRGVTKEEVMAAKDAGKKIKLVGRMRKENERYHAWVKPEVVAPDSPLYNIEGKNKGICYETDILGTLTVIGGASAPQNAAASVLRDILLDLQEGVH